MVHLMVHHIRKDIVHLEISKHNVKYAAIQFFDALPLSIKNEFKAGEIIGFFQEMTNHLIDNAYYTINEFLPNGK